MAEVKLDILVGVRSFVRFGHLSISDKSAVSLATSGRLMSTAAPISFCV